MTPTVISLITLAIALILVFVEIRRHSVKGKVRDMYFYVKNLPSIELITLTILAIEETKQRGLDKCTTAEDFITKEAERHEKT